LLALTRNAVSQISLNDQQISSRFSLLFVFPRLDEIWNQMFCFFLILFIPAGSRAEWTSDCRRLNKHPKSFGSLLRFFSPLHLDRVMTAPLNNRRTDETNVVKGKSNSINQSIPILFIFMVMDEKE
jgi:hypothetical protein